MTYRLDFMGNREHEISPIMQINLFDVISDELQGIELLMYEYYFILILPHINDSPLDWSSVAWENYFKMYSTQNL